MGEEMNREQTREATREAIKVMQAFLDGEQIEYRDRALQGDWYLVSSHGPVWDFLNSEYRAKPKPREWWLCWENDDQNFSFRFSGSLARESVSAWSHCVRVREVLE